MSVLNVSEKTVKVFKECGFDILDYFDKLRPSMNAILSILEYHAMISNPAYSLEERKQISEEFFDLMEKKESLDQVKEFVKNMKMLNKDLVQCVAKTDCQLAKEAVEELIPDIDRVHNFVQTYGDSLKEIMQWMNGNLETISQECNLDYNKIVQVQSKLCEAVCPTINIVKIMLLLFVLMVILLLVRKLN
jgi:hypothetical protein